MNLNSLPAVGSVTLWRMRVPAHVRSVEAIAARLRATRLALDLTQRELCQRAGIETNTYNQWERAKGRPELDKAFRLCDAFGLTLDWIYSGAVAGLPHGLAVKLSGAEEDPPPRRAKRG